MSIVGPRPQMQVDFDKFPADIRDEIYKCQPGITGIGSIIFRDEEKWISDHRGDKHIFYKEKIAPYKAEVEIWYNQNQSIFIDFKLIFLTAWVIFFLAVTLSKIYLSHYLKNLHIYKIRIKLF